MENQAERKSKKLGLTWALTGLRYLDIYSGEGIHLEDWGRKAEKLRPSKVGGREQTHQKRSLSAVTTEGDATTRRLIDHQGCWGIVGYILCPASPTRKHRPGVRVAGPSAQIHHRYSEKKKPISLRRAKGIIPKLGATFPAFVLLDTRWISLLPPLLPPLLTSGT